MQHEVTLGAAAANVCSNLASSALSGMNSLAVSEDA
jgi:hypothetical protein